MLCWYRCNACKEESGWLPQDEVHALRQRHRQEQHSGLIPDGEEWREQEPEKGVGSGEEGSSGGSLLLLVVLAVLILGAIAQARGG